MEIFVAFVLVALAVGAEALWRRLRLPRTLLGHWWAALAWTLLAVYLTFSLLTWNAGSTDILYAAVQFVAGWGMVFSWRDLLRRREAFRFESTSRFQWLRTPMLQTVFGPIVVLLTVGALSYAGNCLMDAAVERRDIVTIGLLRHYGFHADSASAGLCQALETRDLPGICASMEAEDIDGDLWCKQDWLKSEARDHRATTDLLLRYSEVRDSDALVAAVGTGNENQIVTMLRGNVDVNHFGWSDSYRAWFTPLELAEKRRNTRAIQLLKEAGAQESSAFGTRSE